MEIEQEQVREETAIVLDFLPHGYPFDKTPSYRKTPIVQAIGTKRFSLLELAPKEDQFLQPHEEVYIGEGKRDKIHHIIGRLAIDRLTTSAMEELEYVITELVKRNEKRFVEFFNTAQPLTMRMHQLELIPGLGKKHMWEIVERREEKPFDSLEDIRTRVRLMPEPVKALTKRIMAEVLGEEKHRLFVDG